MVDAISTSISGIQNAAQKIDAAAKNIADPNRLAQGGIIEDIIDIKSAEVQFKASVAVLDVTQDLTNELLKIFDKKV